MYHNLLCREIYHTKRMQRVRVVKWSLDNKYIISGSDEMNIRVWKARASEKLGVVSETKSKIEVDSNFKKRTLL